jgi:hypothetical protein
VRHWCRGGERGHGQARLSSRCRRGAPSKLGQGCSEEGAAAVRVMGLGERACTALKAGRVQRLGQRHWWAAAGSLLGSVPGSTACGRCVVVAERPSGLRRMRGGAEALMAGRWSQCGGSRRRSELLCPALECRGWKKREKEGRKREPVNAGLTVFNSKFSI